MAKNFDFGSMITRIVREKRERLIATERSRLQRENDCAGVGQFLNADAELGRFAGNLDRELKMLQDLAEKNCKGFLKDATEYDEAIDIEKLVGQAVEAADYGRTFYFSTVLCQKRRAAT